MPPSPLPPLLRALVVLIGVLVAHKGLASPPNPPDAEWNQVTHYYTTLRGIPQAYLDKWRPYTTGRIVSNEGFNVLPVPSLNPFPGVHLDPTLAALGMVSVVDFGADPTGVADATQAIQQAVDFSRDHAMVCFFPQGTYTISGTIKAWSHTRVGGDYEGGKINREDFYVPVLVGSQAGPTRPKIRLAPGTFPVYTEDQRSFAIEFRNYAPPPSSVSTFKDANNQDRYTYEVYPERLSPLERENLNENTPDHIGPEFRGIDIEIAENNAGASGLRITTAETSGLGDVAITFLGEGHIGLQSPPGGGSATSNIRITGGRIGIDTTGEDWKIRRWTGDLTGTQPTPVLTGITLINQSELAIRSQVRGSFVAVGLHIESNRNGPVMQFRYSWYGDPFSSSVSIVDSKIIYNTPTPVGNVVIGRRTDAEDKNRSFYLDNVYVKNAEHAYIATPNTSDTSHLPANTFATNPIGWHHIKRLAYERKPRNRDYDTNEDGTLDSVANLRERVYINGAVHGNFFYEALPLPSGSQPPADLCSRHLYQGEFPHFESPGVKIITDFGAVGDATTDCTSAIQAAIDAAEADGSNVVFVPRGYFKIRDTLQLHPNTKLIGLARQWSGITSSQADGVFGTATKRSDYAAGIPLVRTANSATADTVIAHLMIAPGYPIKAHNGWYDGSSGTVTRNTTQPGAINPDEAMLETYALLWQAGGTSVVRECFFSPRKQYSFHYNLYDEFTYEGSLLIHPLIRISGHGGGRWYGFHFHGYHPFGPEGNILRIENNLSPIHFYHLHAQHCTALNLLRFDNVRYISVYGFKTEHHKTLLKATDSQHLRLFGLGGIGTPAPGKEHFYLQDNSDFLLATPGDQAQFGKSYTIGSGWSVMYMTNLSRFELFRDIQGATTSLAAFGERPTLYMRGEPHAGYATGVHRTYTATFQHTDHGTLTGPTTQTLGEGANSASVTAVPDPDYMFIGWTGDVTSTANPLYLHDVQGNKTLTAHFIPFNEKPVLTVTTPRTGDVFFEGEPVALIGTASDAEDGDLTPSSTWHSHRDGLITSGTVLSVGPHQITFSATDSTGQTVSQILSIDVLPKPIVVASFTGTNPAQNTPWTPVRIQATHLLYGGIVRGSGEGGRSSTDCFEIQHGTTNGEPASTLSDAIAENRYIGFTLTPQDDRVLNLNGARFRVSVARQNTAAPRDFTLMSSVGGFTPAALIGTRQQTLSTTDYQTLEYTFSGSQYDGLATPVEIRLYLHNSTWGRWVRIKDLSLSGGTLTLPGSDNFSSWIASFSSLSDSSPHADPDMDGIANLFEYLYNTDPGVPNAPLPLTLSTSSTQQLQLHITLPTTLPGSLQLTLQGTHTLSNWENADLAEGAGSTQYQLLTTDHHDGTLTRTYQLNSPIGHPDAPKFLRLKLSE